MLLAFTLAVGVLQSPKMGPTLPPGIDEHFAHVVLQVEERLLARDFAGADNAAKLLPDKTIMIGWDDSKVPVGLRSLYAGERDKAIGEWERITGCTISVGGVHPSLSFEFESSLPQAPDEALPAGEVWTWSVDLAQPRLRTILAMQRGNPLEQIDPINVRNEVARSLGAYLGLERSSYPGTLMGPMELNFHQLFPPTEPEIGATRQALDISDQLREAVRARLRLTPTRPKIVIAPNAIDMGEVLQGDPSPFQVQIDNPGNAPLALRFTPDCGCVVTEKETTVEPGGHYVLKGRYDTSLRTGDIRHELSVSNNDPDNGTTRVPIHVLVNSRYRFLLAGGAIVKLPKTGATLTAYLCLAHGSALEAKNVAVTGVPGTATIAKWSGSLADPEMNEPSKPRTGYKITVHLTGQMVSPDRSAGAIVVETKDPQFPTLMTSFYAQRGIIAMPSQLFLGEVGTKPLAFTLVISGPTKAFRVTRVTSDWPHLSCYIYPNVDGSEFRIQANYDGKAPKGQINGTMRVETDDPERSVISIPIAGSAR